MKRKVARITFDNVETDETGEYCNSIMPNLCNSLMLSKQNIKKELRFYCRLLAGKDRREKRLTIRNNKPFRCQACIDAEKMVWEIKVK